MSIAFMPYYVTDYDGDTGHLNLEEDGAYGRLLRLCWRTPGCSVPNDHKWIARKMRIDTETFERVVVPLIDEFMTVKKNRVFQKRQLEIYFEVNLTFEKRSFAGKKGVAARKALKTNETNLSPDDSPDEGGDKQPKPKPKPKEIYKEIEFIEFWQRCKKQFNQELTKDLFAGLVNSGRVSGRNLNLAMGIYNETMKGEDDKYYSEPTKWLANDDWIKHLKPRPPTDEDVMKAWTPAFKKGTYLNKDAVSQSLVNEMVKRKLITRPQAKAKGYN